MASPPADILRCPCTIWHRLDSVEEKPPDPFCIGCSGTGWPPTVRSNSDPSTRMFSGAAGFGVFGVPAPAPYIDPHLRESILRDVRIAKRLAEELEQRRAVLEQNRDYWIAVASGERHDERCPNAIAGWQSGVAPRGGRLCQQCQVLRWRAWTMRLIGAGSVLLVLVVRYAWMAQ